MQRKIKKPISSLDGRRWEVDNLGHVLCDGCIQEVYTDDRGYLCISLHVNKKPVRVHRLVAEGFHGLCPTGKEVNHKNLIKIDNWPENLEYVTHKENVRHALMSYGKIGRYRILSSVQVLEIRKLYERTHLPYCAIAVRYGVDRVSVSRIVRRKSWSWL